MSAIMDEETIRNRDIVRKKLINKTYIEVRQNLNKYKKCMLIRPTGFGKTFLMAELTRKYKNVLYLYPLDIIRLEIVEKYAPIIKKDDPDKEIDCMSYMKLVSMYKSDKLDLLNRMQQYDLILCDEAHMTGATKTLHVLRNILPKCTKAHILGATATPERSDGIDVTAELFDGHIISEYTLADAIHDKLLPKPYYVYSIYEAVDPFSGLLTEISKYTSVDERESLIDELNALEIEIGTLINASDVIRQNILQAYGQPNYMKFIVFFSEKATLASKSVDVRQWFMQAFPDMKLNTLTITSDAEYSDKVEELDSLRARNNTIDLIFCINKLNMGYHISDLTGVIMLRGTYSNIIWKQQIGRCMSVDSNITPIIFDFVNNLFKKPYYVNSYESDGSNAKSGAKALSNSRLNDLSERDLIINDTLARYTTFIKRVLDGRPYWPMEKVIECYVYKNMPMKEAAIRAGMYQKRLRQEFEKKGITIVD